MKPAAQMKPVLVRLDDVARLGFEVDRADAGPVSVYLPGSPDPWQGVVVHVEPGRVEPDAPEPTSELPLVEPDPCESIAGRGDRVRVRSREHIPRELAGRVEVDAPQSSRFVPDEGSTRRQHD